MAIFGKLGTSGSALRILSVFLGVFLVAMGLNKLDWLTDSGPLVGTLQGWRGNASSTDHHWSLSGNAVDSIAA